ncbi:unnamed protein product, partial [Didymodactylos carnosus]
SIFPIKYNMEQQFRIIAEWALAHDAKVRGNELKSLEIQVSSGVILLFPQESYRGSSSPSRGRHSTKLEGSMKTEKPRQARSSEVSLAFSRHFERPRPFPLSSKPISDRQCTITLKYSKSSLQRRSSSLEPIPDEIVVLQEQNHGQEHVIVYKGFVKPGGKPYSPIPNYI